MWKPILDGALAQRAREDSSAIAEALAGLDLASSAPRYGEAGDPSLGSGAAGQAVAFAYLDEAQVFPGGGQKAGDLLELAIGAMAESSAGPSLLAGYSGIAWAVEALGWSTPGDDEDELSEVDAELLTAVAEKPWSDDYDLGSGLVGFGVYALERLPRARARATLSEIVQRLEETAETDGAAVTWLTRADQLNELQREGSPDGYYNLGMAHGISGVIALLARACAAEIEVERVRRLLKGAVTWLFAQRRDDAPRFDYWTGRGSACKRSRSAWCYGDPGVAAALFLAGRATGDAEWLRAALELAREAAARPFAESGAVDAPICHGTAGLAHIYNRLYQASGDEELRRAAVLWIERTLDMRKDGAGIGGYLTAIRNESGETTFEPDTTFLSGAPGVAMALAAAVSDAEPVWDRVLLLSGCE
jgi:hypothetical protein